MSQQGKIDKVYEEVIKMEDRLIQLENNQKVHFEQYIEKASASIIAELKRQLSQLIEKIEKTEYNREILDLLNQEKGKNKDGDIKKDHVKEILQLGWYPENLKIKENSFYLKKNDKEQT